MSTKFASTTAPILEVLVKRWSPRSYSPNHELTVADLTPSLEAARWAPSAGNSQPARFAVAFRGSEGFNTVLNNLDSSNAYWAKNASALIVNIAEVHDDKGRDRRWAEYDLGQAVAHFSVQAHADGLYVHQMGGFDARGIESDLELSEAQRAVSVMAVGILADAHASDLSESHLKQELGARSRHDLADFVRYL